MDRSTKIFLWMAAACFIFRLPATIGSSESSPVGIPSAHHQHRVSHPKGNSLHYFDDDQLHDWSQYGQRISQQTVETGAAEIPAAPPNPSTSSYLFPRSVNEKIHDEEITPMVLRHIQDYRQSPGAGAGSRGGGAGGGDTSFMTLSFEQDEKPFEQRQQGPPHGSMTLTFQRSPQQQQRLQSLMPTEPVSAAAEPQPIDWRQSVARYAKEFGFDLPELDEELSEQQQDATTNTDNRPDDMDTILRQFAGRQIDSMDMMDVAKSFQS